MASPAFHHWHHTNDDPALIDKNYAPMFPWVDRLFGTLYLPPNRHPAVYGTDTAVSPGLIGQLLDPFIGASHDRGRRYEGPGLDSPRCAGSGWDSPGLDSSGWATSTARRPPRTRRVSLPAGAASRWLRHSPGAGRPRRLGGQQPVQFGGQAVRAAFVLQQFGDDRPIQQQIHDRGVFDLDQSLGDLMR